jgi:predicted nucleotidyltransferase
VEDPVSRTAGQIGGVLAAGPPLKLAILFGSAVRGGLRPESDLDIAILPADPSLPLASELDLQVGLASATGRPVDLVRLDHAPTLLLWEIARHGRILLSNPPAERVRFLSEVACQHADFAPAFQHAARLFRKRLAARTGGTVPPQVADRTR